ncbi:MAG TPA: hypothetical protein VFZ09_32600 [Archangium sp.]|nr:hypothetical protein [Archangium sp.]HEX5751012.1 hypothetical protein [Archangium sp.]
MDIAVQQAVAVQVGERGERLGPDAHPLRQGQGGLRHGVTNRVAAGVLQRGVAGLSGVEGQQATDVLMRGQPGHEGELPLEELALTVRPGTLQDEDLEHHGHPGAHLPRVMERHV